MKKEFNDYFKQIKETSISELALAGSISEDMVRKYKRSHSLPPLNIAVIFEDKFNIPARLWVDLKISKEVK